MLVMQAGLDMSAVEANTKLFQNKMTHRQPSGNAICHRFLRKSRKTIASQLICLYLITIRAYQFNSRHSQCKSFWVCVSATETQTTKQEGEFHWI